MHLSYSIIAIVLIMRNYYSTAFQVIIGIWDLSYYI